MIACARSAERDEPTTRQSWYGETVTGGMMSDKHAGYLPGDRAAESRGQSPQRGPMPDQNARVSLLEVAPAERTGLQPETAEPPPASVPAAPSAEPKATADEQTKGVARYRRRVLLVLSAIVLALVLYSASGYCFPYTVDVYITSDL